MPIALGIDIVTKSSLEKLCIAAHKNVPPSLEYTDEPFVAVTTKTDAAKHLFERFRKHKPRLEGTEHGPNHGYFVDDLHVTSLGDTDYFLGSKALIRAMAAHAIINKSKQEELLGRYDELKQMSSPFARER